MRKLLFLIPWIVPAWAQDTSPRYVTPSVNTAVLRFQEWRSSNHSSSPFLLILESEPLSFNAELPTYLNSQRKPQQWDVNFYVLTYSEGRWVHHIFGGLSAFLWEDRSAKVWPPDFCHVAKGKRWRLELPTDPKVLAEYSSALEGKTQEFNDLRFNWNDPKRDGFLIVMPIQEKIRFWEAFKEAVRRSKALLSSEKANGNSASGSLEK